MATKNENLEASWLQDFFLKVEPCLARSFSLPSLSMVEYSSGYLLCISYLTMTESCINKRKSIEITSLQERKNSSLGGLELTWQ